MSASILLISSNKLFGVIMFETLRRSTACCRKLATKRGLGQHAVSQEIPRSGKAWAGSELRRRT